MAQEADIDPKMQAESAFQAVARMCVERFRDHLTELRQNWDAEALHQARVGLRQLMAAFTLFRPMIEDQAFPSLRDRIKTATRSLGDARNLDVILEAAHRPDLPALRSTVSLLRSRAYADMTQRLESGSDGRLADDLLDWLEHGAWRRQHADLRHRPLAKFAARRLDKRWRKFLERSRHVDKLAPGARHKVRIAAKKLRYGLEFMGPLAQRRKARKRRRALIATMKEMQDALGALNDLRTERQMADTFMQEGRESAFAAGRLIGVHETSRDPLLRQAAKAARRLRKKKPFW
jgi:CHAD domain-containing protein